MNLVLMEFILEMDCIIIAVTAAFVVKLLILGILFSISVINKLSAEVFDRILVRANLVTKTSFDDKLKIQNQIINLKKENIY